MTGAEVEAAVERALREAREKASREGHEIGGLYMPCLGVLLEFMKQYPEVGEAAAAFGQRKYVGVDKNAIHEDATPKPEGA